MVRRAAPPALRSRPTTLASSQSKAAPTSGTSVWVRQRQLAARAVPAIRPAREPEGRRQDPPPRPFEPEPGLHSRVVQNHEWLRWAIGIPGGNVSVEGVVEGTSRPLFAEGSQRMPRPVHPSIVPHGRCRGQWIAARQGRMVALICRSDRPPVAPIAGCPASCL